MRLKSHLKHLFSWGGTWKGLERLLGCQFMIVKWCLCSYPYRINNQTGDILVPIRDTLWGCSLAFSEGGILPQKSDNFDAWYKRLPIHKRFLQGKESEIHYLAPDNEQPDFPFVYVDWNVDCELSEEDNNEEGEKNTITKNITWNRDRCDYMDY